MYILGTDLKRANGLNHVLSGFIENVKLEPRLYQVLCNNHTDLVSRCHGVETVVGCQPMSCTNL